MYILLLLSTKKNAAQNDTGSCDVYDDEALKGSQRELKL